MPNSVILPLHFVSYSSLNLFHSCPRKLELYKMGEPRPEFKSFHFTYGTAVGDAVQELLKTGDMNKAYLKAFTSWDMELLSGIESDTDSKKKNHAKSFPFVIDALKKFEPHCNITLSEYEVYHFLDEVTGEMRPATELSAKVYLPNGFVYRIYIDVVLRHKETGELVVLELKTDGSKIIQDAKYANSNQALSYSVILDKIAPGNTSFYVWYFVYYTSLERWEFFPFAKSRLQKANWIQTVLYDTGNIHQCIENDFFPQQGESCIDYGSPCQYYGACGMSNNSMYAGPSVIKQRLEKEEEEKYDFTFTIEELVNQQLEEMKS